MIDIKIQYRNIEQEKWTTGDDAKLRSTEPSYGSIEI